MSKTSEKRDIVDKTRERLESEKKRLIVLEEKQKRCRENIAKLEEMLRGMRFSEAEHVINLSGFTLEELVVAAQKGDFASLHQRAAQRQKPPAESNLERKDAP